MLTQEDYQPILKIYQDLKPNLQKLEIQLNQFEKEKGDTQEYKKLIEFEKTAYGEIIDFKTHTLGLIALISTSLKTLTEDKAEEKDELKKTIKEAGKKSIIETSLPKVIENLINNLTSFSDVSSEHKEVCNSTVKYLNDLKSQVAVLSAKMGNQARFKP